MTAEVLHDIFTGCDELLVAVRRCSLVRRWSTNVRRIAHLYKR